MTCFSIILFHSLILTNLNVLQSLSQPQTIGVHGRHPYRHSCIHVSHFEQRTILQTTSSAKTIPQFASEKEVFETVC
jgi:hypothetical protein